MPGQSFKDDWGAIDQATNPDEFVQVMEQAHQEQSEEPEVYGWVCEQLEVRAGDQLLEVGCGLGGAARAVAQRVGEAGRVTGVDNSATVIAEARKRSSGLELPLTFQVANVHELPFADNSFDGCWAESLFEIVEDPERALAEMARVTKPGARIAITAPDLGTMAIDSPYRETTRKILDYVCDNETNGWIGRQLPGLLFHLGFKDISVMTNISLAAEYEGTFGNWMQRYAQRAQEAGVVQADEAAAWLRDLEQRGQAGRFFSVTTLFGVAGRKPQL